MAITLEKATSGGIDAVPLAAGGKTLSIATLPADVSLELTLDVDKTTADIKVTHQGTRSDATVAWAEPTNATTNAKTFKGTFQLTTSDDYGTYLVTAVGVTGRDTLELSATKTVPAQPHGTPPSAVIENEPGEFDKLFLLLTFCLFTVLTVATLVGSAYLIGKVYERTFATPPATPAEHAVETWISNTNAEAVAGMAVLLAIAVGSVLLLIGGWLAALEVRGRLRRKLTTTVTGDDAVTRGTATEVSEGPAKAIEALKTARGTIAVLSVAAIVIVAALFAAVQVSEDSRGPAEAPTQSPTDPTSPASTPPDSPAESPAESPNDSPAETPADPSDTAEPNSSPAPSP